MTKKIMLLLISVVITLIFIPFTVFAAIQVNAGEGWNVYKPSAAEADYRYGPTIIVNSDNSIDMWASSQGSGSQWDWIRYKKSTDGGHTWGNENVVLTPTNGSADAFSCCDPGVVKFGGYYYLGYTGTINTYGCDNNIFVARSTSPSGPFEKWNGSGWGGNPKPFIVFDGQPSAYGAGTPCFIVKDGTLYIYYTWCDVDSSGKGVNSCRVSTASASDPNWPGNITYLGEAFKGVPEDVKYIDSYNKFIISGTEGAFSNESRTTLLESTDGLTFTPSTVIRDYAQPYSHNSGLSGNDTGHIDVTKNNFIVYAYGKPWGLWSLYMQPLSFSNNNIPAVPDIDRINEGDGKATIYFKATAGVSYKINYGTSSGNYTNTITGIAGSPYTVTGLTNGTTYYFTVVASNTNGDSGNSAQLNATPLNYTDSPRVSATASSYMSGLEASKAIDSDPMSTWSSTYHTSGSATEWIYVDTGANRAIKRVTLTPRLYGELCFPTDYKIQVSTDAVNWTDANCELGIYSLTDSYRVIVHNFKYPIYGRYVRVYATKLGADNYGNYYMQLNDIKIEQITYNAASSTNLTNWDSYKVFDGSSGCWSSMYHSSSSATEWVYLDTGLAKSISGIQLKPRGYCFPVDFKLQYSNDAVTWTDIPGQAYTNYPNPGSSLQTFKFGSPVTARYVRVYATKLSADDHGNYYFQLDEFYISTQLQLTAAASSQLTGWWASSAVDKIDTSFWSSVSHTNENSTEWVYVDIGSTKTVSGIKIVPRPNYCFPKEIVLQYSNDGVTWSPIIGQTYHDYCNPGGDIQYFKFSSLVNTRYIRIYATKLSTDDMGNYYFQLGEIYVDQ